MNIAKPRGKGGAPGGNVLELEESAGKAGGMRNISRGIPRSVGPFVCP